MQRSTTDDIGDMNIVPADSAPSDLASPYARWSKVARELAETLSHCAVCLQSKLSRDGQHGAQQIDWQVVLDGVHRGVAQAFTFANQDASPTEPGTATTDTRRALEHPLAQLGRAYAAAFEAVGLVCLLLGTTSATDIPPSAREFVELGRRAALALAPGLDLAFGRRRLGSVAQMCDHVGALENQADSLFRSATATLLGPPGRPLQMATQAEDTAAEAQGEVSGEQEAEERWTAQRAATLRLLVALEMLTDRCEDIADALLLVERLH